jgi:acetyl esterase
VREAFDAGRGLFGRFARSDLAEDRFISGPGGDLGLRVVTADRVDGVYLHFHGGGWVVGSAAQNDERLEGIARNAGVAVVSVDYRLAPEHPYPAPAVGAVLTYGIFDLGLTPSAKAFGSRPLVLTTTVIEWLAAAYAGDADVTDPDVSPLLADLTGFPPALVVVGTNYPLVDDSVLMAERLGAVGTPVELHVVPGAAHGFTSSEIAASEQARAAIWRFIADRVA